jgi:hypothetical protein
LLKEESEVNIQKYVNEELPAQYETTGLSEIIDLAWHSIDPACNKINIFKNGLFNYSETNQRSPYTIF